MTLDELKAAMETAKKLSLAKPEDKALLQAAADAEKAYDDAKKKADDEAQKLDADEFDEEKADPKAKAYIKKLRDEAAAQRVKNKDLASKFKTSEEQKKAILKAAGIEIDSEKPEEKIKNLQGENQNLAFRQAVLEAAVQNGIAKTDLDFFEFLITKAAADLAEGEELSDEQMKEIVGKCKKSGNGTTSVNGKEKKPADDNPGAVTLDQFCKMSMMQKNDLYLKNKELYEDLMSQAKAKNRVV